MPQEQDNPRKRIRRCKLTKRAVDTFKPEPDEYVVWDSEVPGFGLRVRPSGRKVYLYKYRVHGGRKGQPRKPAIGLHGAITPDEARTIAKQWAREVAMGGDPGGERKAQREAPTVADLCERYLKEHAEPYKAERSIEEDRRNIRLHIKPAFARKKVSNITHADAEALHHSMRETPFSANRVAALGSKMFNLAEKWKYRPLNSNPWKHLRKYPEAKRERDLSSNELARLAGALNDPAHPAPAVAAIRLLIFTGARRDEVLTLKWEWIDLNKSEIRLPDSKTGARPIHLSAPALEVLSNIKRVKGNPHVIVGKKPDAHLTDLEKPWQRVRRQAGLSDLRLHDLRHHFGGVGASSNLGLPMIGRMLGHREPRTTARYARAAPDPTKQAVEVVAGKIAAAMAGENAEVVSLPRRRSRGKQT